MNLPLALKAELLLAVQLVTRHRAPRLVLLLVGSLVLVLMSGGPEAADLAGRQRTILLMGGALGAVSGARLLARGGALGSARCVATLSVVPVAGRLAGSLLISGPVLLAVSGAVLPTAVLGQTLAAVLLLCAATTAATMALAPAVGASSAAAVGFIAVLLGGAPPSAVGAVLAGWPLLRTPMVLAWNALPLAWRPARWLAAGSLYGDPWVLAAWLVAAVWLATLAVDRFPERGAAGSPA